MRTTVTRTALAILVALALATATAQKDFEDVSAGLLRALEATERPCALHGVSPDEATYTRCGLILDTLTVVNKTIIERHFANAGYSLVAPWESERLEQFTFHVIGFGRPGSGFGEARLHALRYAVFYVEDPAHDASVVWILADWR